MRKRWPLASGRALGLSGFWAVLLLLQGSIAAQEPNRPLLGTMPQTGPEHFVGLWTYNSADSRNIATGQPERGPRGSAPPRPIVARPAVAAREDDGTRRADPFAPSPEMLRENRDLSRDLLEIAETLTFAVTERDVTIVDDLGRSHTYPTDNSRDRYRLGASEFQARVRWEDGRLYRDIEGRYGFRLSETYYLSPDAARLFVIIRVGSPERGRLQAGVDRVYDRTLPEDND